MNESDYKNKISRMLKGMDFWVYVPRDYIHKGIADLLALSPQGRFFAIELKVMDKKTPNPQITPIQMAFLREIARKNGISIIMVVDEEMQTEPHVLLTLSNLYHAFVKPEDLGCKKLQRLFRNNFIS